MPIPKAVRVRSGRNAILPPFLKSPIRRDCVSPYLATPVELVERYATSKQRIRILEGLLAYRAELRRIGLRSGIQWIDGSFVEAMDREPNDVDVVTIAPLPSTWIPEDEELFDADKARARSLCDAWFVDLSTADLAGLISDVTYWFGLFSHQKQSQQWKGMVQLELVTTDSDAAASMRLATLKGESHERRG
ncbi:hypothetical protein WMF31_38530 [Sorangium sp. So ce1036]|uniref:DUF6932 family protein n=1 Tax=Sorangium sp. So ce1036 TaxID=3133328 RepID=UPI003F02932D